MSQVQSFDFVNHFLSMIEDEYMRARTKHAPMINPHHGASIIREEHDEFWHEIKANNLLRARTEVVQLAAMCLAFLVEVNEDDNRKVVAQRNVSDTGLDPWEISS